MSGLEQIRAINSWAKSEECKNLARSLNKGKHEGKDKGIGPACRTKSKAKG